MKFKLKTVSDVVSWRMCVGCGACEYICENRNVSLQNFTEHGIRPVLGINCIDCGKCTSVCPGLNNTKNIADVKKAIPELMPHCGFAVEVWEGYANDNFLRNQSSSGGVSTALALYYLEHEQCEGVLHTVANADNPAINDAVFSTNRASIIKAIGSRYAPAAPCAGLGTISKSKDKCVFVGKPCDISALRNVQAIDENIRKKVGLAIGIFCAGTPSIKGTQDLLCKNAVNLNTVKTLNYRGNGWPGWFCVKNECGNELKIPYPESWSFLQKYRPFRCYLCADGTSETADVSCGDAWYLRGKEENGISLINVRNENGKRILHSAVKKGYITLRQISNQNVFRSQEQLFSRQKEIWGRLQTLKAFGIPVPKYNGWPLARNWISLPNSSKFKSIGSTMKRILQRKLFLPVPNSDLKDAIVNE